MKKGGILLFFEKLFKKNRQIVWSKPFSCLTFVSQIKPTNHEQISCYVDDERYSFRSCL